MVQSRRGSTISEMRYMLHMLLLSPRCCRRCRYPCVVCVDVVYCQFQVSHDATSQDICVLVGTLRFSFLQLRLHISHY